ncbi:MAG TPA: hypothetical protein VFA18_15015, partial [Gemmataceae bacterium]|nr:hypothetical protein [Gemmataceae bacterium]
MSNLSKEKQAPTGPLFFRFAPEYRRCGMYLFVGYLLFAGILIGLEQVGLTQRGWGPIILVLAILALPMLGGALCLYRQRLRVDERGVWRRRFFRWDLWPWEAFAAGQVRQGTYKDRFILPSKPWWNRSLCLEFLSDHEREHLVNRIRDVWMPPPLPVLPAELTIRWGLRRWACLSDTGIKVGRGKRAPGCFFPWTTVLRVRLTRLEHGRRDFRAVEILLPGVARPILLRLHEGRPLWTGADAETLGAFLERTVPPDHLLLTAMAGPPRTLAEADWRLLDVNRMEREAKQMAWIPRLWLLAGILWFVLFIILRVDEPNPPPWGLARTIGAVAMFLCMGLPLIVWGHLLLRRKKQVKA